MEERIIEDAIEMTKNIPWTDVLTPIIPEEKELAPYPEVEYIIVEAPSMDKLVRDVNNHLKCGWVCDGGVQITTNNLWAKFYQSMERWKVPTEEVFTEKEKQEEINYGIREEDYPRKTEEEIEQEELAEEN